MQQPPENQTPMSTSDILEQQGILDPSSMSKTNIFTGTYERNERAYVGTLTYYSPPDGTYWSFYSPGKDTRGPEYGVCEQDEVRQDLIRTFRLGCTEPQDVAKDTVEIAQSSCSLTEWALPPQKQRGALIVVEGIDRAGKSTLVAAIEERLKSINIPVRRFVFPMYGDEVTDALLKHVRKEQVLDPRTACLMFAANRHYNFPMIEGYINDGTTVVLDRYCHSGVAYGMANGLPMGWCVALEQGLPVPDVQIRIDILPSEASKREGFGKDVYDNEAFQEKVRHAFNTIPVSCLTLHHRSGANIDWIVTECKRVIEQVKDPEYSTLYRF